MSGATVQSDGGALAARLGVRVVRHGVVGSTMDVARDDRGPLPAVHVAISQTTGRGRRGRAWASPPGNLHATILWPDPGAAWPPAVLAAVQLAVAEAVVAAGGPDARCRWPNDGTIDGAKWCGAIAERRTDPPPALLVGLGANLTTEPDLPAGAPAATTLAAHGSPWPAAADAEAALLAAALDVLRSGPDALSARLGRWRERDALAPGEPLRIELPEGGVEGRYAGLAPDGRLRLRASSGERLFAAGDVVRLRPAG